MDRILSPFQGVYREQLESENAVKAGVPCDSTGLDSTALGYNYGDNDTTAVTVLLSGGFHALVDLADYDRVAAHKWTHHTNGKQHYALRERMSKRIYLHRFILDAPDGFFVDHINGDGLDCRRANMRIVTKSQNTYNKAASIGREGMKGVSKSGSRWRACIKHNYVMYRLGTFATAEEAARAYDAKARELFGEFARTNF